MSGQVRRARELWEALQSRYREAADALMPGINVMRELEETSEYLQGRSAALEAAKGILTEEALKALELPGAATSMPKRASGGSPNLFRATEGPDELDSSYES